MMTTFLTHQWKEFWRSRSAGKNMAAQIFIGFIILYLLASALILGLALRHFLSESFPRQDIIRIFCGFILYYFSFDLLTRFMVQELPVLSILPYLGQNIRRRQLVAFLNLRSLFHFLNLLPLFIFIPFILTVIATAHGPLVAACFTLSVLSITLFNHFLILYVKRKIIINSWWLVGFLGVAGVLIALEHFHVFSFRSLSTSLFSPLLTNPWLSILFILASLASYINNSRFLRHNLYFEEIARKGRRRQSADYVWLQQWGLTGELVALNIKLVLRNKRPRFVAFFSVFILLYGFLFYKPVYLQTDHFQMVLTGALFITGIFILNYGQFLFAWHSSYFDGLMSSNINIPTFIRSQFVLFIAVSTFAFVVTSLYGLISWKIIPVQVAAYLYNIGVNTVLTVYFATRSYKGLDMTKSAAFNYQGTGLTQFIYVAVIMVVPLLIYWLLALAFNPWTGIIILGSLGLVSLLLQNWWIPILVDQFHQRKHTILEGFREK
jgi:hypothetical protein